MRGFKLERYLGQAFVWRYNMINTKLLIPLLVMVGEMAVAIFVFMDTHIEVCLIIILVSMISTPLWLIAGMRQYQYQFAQEGNALFYVTLRSFPSFFPPFNGNMLTLAQADCANVRQIVQVTSISETRSIYKVTCYAADLNVYGSFSEVSIRTILVSKDIQNLDSLMARLYALQGQPI